jgi:hypothetical protein
MSEDTISRRVSREELAVLLRLLGARSLPGLGEDLLAGLNEDEQGLLLAAGRRALLARGALEERPNAAGELEVLVEPPLLALVGECLRAPVVTVINRLGTEPPPAVWYVHQGPNLRVIHRLVASGVHEFVGTVDLATVEAAVLGLFPFAEGDHLPAAGSGELASSGEPARNGESAGRQGPAAAAFRLPQAAMDDAIAQVRVGRLETAVAGLAAAGAGMHAAAFAAALQDVRANSMLARVDLGAAAAGDAGAAESFALVEGLANVWMLQTVGNGDSEVLEVRRTTGPELAAAVAQVLA